MIYEIKITWRTLRQEGFQALGNKLTVYFQQLAQALVFCCRRIPRAADVKQQIDFGTTVASGLIRSTQVRSEISQLATLVHQRQPKTVVEIGTANGGTLFLWCRLAHPSATVISIDLPGGIHGGGYPYWKSWLYRRFPQKDQKLQLLRGDSHQPEMLAQLKKILPGDGKVDFLFIDGDHTYAGVKMDFEMYSPLVRPGGFIAFHDICRHREHYNCQVDRFWHEIKTERQVREFVHDPEQGICGIGVIEV